MNSTTPTASPDFTEAEHRYRAQVVQRWNHLDFSGLGAADLFLTDVTLENIFVRLNLTVEKVIREPAPPEDRETAAPGRGRRGKQTRTGPGQEQPRERITLVQEPISLADALQGHLLIAGEPGAGKSALLRWLAVTFAQGQQRQPDRLGHAADADRLPILVELGRLPECYLQSESREAPQWQQFLPEYIAGQDAFANTPHELLRRTLADGRCLLLFDGLDEIADPQARLRIAGSLAELARLPSGNRLVICSRPAGLGESEAALRPLFRRGQIQRFTPDDVQRFFQFWYARDAALTPEQQRQGAVALFAKVQTEPKVLDLATTPLLSTILLLIWRNTGRLPARRGELYEQCCRVLLEHWEAHHDVAGAGGLAGLGWERHLRLLAPLAYAIHSQEQRTDAGRTELIPVLARGLQGEGLSADPQTATLAAERFLKTLALRSGLLQHLGGDRYGFPHLTFQEYLAGRHIAAQPDPDDTIDLVMAHLHEAWWREVHLLTIGHLGSGDAGATRASALLLTILNLYRPPWPWLKSRRLSFWTRLPSLIARMLPRWQLERRQAWVLAREFEFAANGYSDCTSSGVTEAARRELREAAAALLLCIVHDQGQWKNGLLTATCRALAGQSSPKVVVALMSALGDEDAYVQQAAAKSLERLGQAGSQEAVASLVRALGDADEAMWEVVARSLEQLDQAGNQETVAALVHALSDEDWIVRVVAAESLGRLGQAGSPEVVAVLIRTLRDKVADVRAAAAASLGQLGQAGPEVVAALVRALGDENADVRVAATRLVGEAQAESDIVTTEVRALRAENAAVRFVAAASLGQVERVESQEAMAALVHALSDANAAVRVMAARSLRQLGQTGSQETIAGLIRALGDKESAVRWAAVESLGLLGQMGSQEVASALICALDDEVAAVRAVTARSLGRFGQAASQEARAGLVRALDDKAPVVRQVAAASLGQLGQVGLEAVAALVRVLSDVDVLVRQAAAASLGQLKVEDEKELRKRLVILNRVLHDTNDDVRRAALESIRALLDGRPIPGYRWTPLRARRARARRWKRIGFWTLVGAGVLLVTLAGAWLLTNADPNSFVVRFLSGLAVLLGALGAIAQILGRALRDPWDKAR
jgi:HEAT repeat protein